jgi:hypothetical protein
VRYLRGCGWLGGRHCGWRLHHHHTLKLLIRLCLHGNDSNEDDLLGDDHAIAATDDPATAYLFHLGEQEVRCGNDDLHHLAFL